jgi:uncharacterized membrane protein
MSSTKLPWQFIALISGGFAALNGVFAKLTTAETTRDFAFWIANKLETDPNDQKLATMVEGALRMAVFVSSFVISALMWTLYTRALASAPSAIQANVMNTAANFVLAALFGVILFGETLGGSWWLGASLLIAGTVIIGKRTSSETPEADMVAKKTK